MATRKNDAVDRIVDAWRQARPDLDLRAMETIGRLGRAMQFVHRLVEARLREFGLSVGDFDVLASLRRAGKPYRLTPTQLYTNLMLTSGTITNRIDRLEARGLVARVDDPDDRRGVLVSLTPEGLRTVDAAVSAHVANETRLLSALTPAERSTLDATLRKLLRGVEAMDAADAAPPEPAITATARARAAPRARRTR